MIFQTENIMICIFMQNVVINEKVNKASVDASPVGSLGKSELRQIRAGL